MNLYITADNIGTPTGGGTVTYHESKALQGINPNFKSFEGNYNEADPFKIDINKMRIIMDSHFTIDDRTIVHFYAGCFTETIKWLKTKGCKITYTCAAHSIPASKKAHEDLGIDFAYPHLVDKDLWEKYVEGYRSADVVICPSKYSMDVCASYGCRNIQVIPHGVYLPEEIQPLPKRFVLGYLGAIGPDKGLVYLLKAWKKLSYSDSLLIIAGQFSTHDWMRKLVKEHGGGAINLAGWMQSPSDLYNTCMTYCQPSVTEGFGCEVLEAMAHGRIVICSNGAGACDVVNSSFVVGKADVDELASMIDFVKKMTQDQVTTQVNWNLKESKKYTWDKIQEQYISLWKSLIEV